MRSLDRNRVFDTKELEQLREDTYTVLEQAINVSEQYNQDRDEVMELFDRVPAEARCSRFPLILPTDFVYPEYADQQKKCNDIFENILCHIPQFDKEAADANEELISEIKETTRTVEELRELLKTGDLRLSVSAFEAKLKQICGPDFSEEEQAKMDLHIQTLGLVSNTVLTADPVNVVNGDFVLQENDLSIRGVPFLSFVRCIKKTDPYGGETKFSYDEEGRVNGVTDPLGTFHTIRTQRFQVTDREDFKEPVSNNPENPDKEPVPDYREEQISGFPPLTVTEERDANKRLCKRTYPGGVESIYEYGNNGRIKSILHKDPEGILEKREYTYDGMGNCIAIQKQSRNQTKAEETVCYRYDKLGRLIQVSQNQSLIREYQYDALGNRMKKWEMGQETWYHNRKNEFTEPVTLVCKKGTEEELLYEVTTKELHFTYRVSTLPVTLEIEGETKYLLTDHLGSILRILDKEGNTEKVYEYDEYGNALFEEPQYIGYAGYPATGNGTYVTGRRFYHPAQGRFLSRDLWFGNLGDPQTYNQYLYAVDNPIRYRDASGMSPTESALLKNPFEEETKEFSFPTGMDKAVAQTTSGIRKGRITEPLYQETGLDWLEKSVDWLMDTPYGDALSYSFILMNPSFVASSYLKGLLIDGKSGEEVTQEFMEHSRGFHGSLIQAISKQLYHIVTFPDTVKAEGEEIADISHCTNQTGFSRVFYTGNEYLNRKLDRIENGIKGTINAYLNGNAKTKGEIEGKLLFSIAEIAATRPMVNKPIKPDGVDDKQIKQTIEERKQADIEELYLLLSYEKDLTGSEKKYRDTIINRIFEEGDIPKMREVEEKLSKKGNSKWTQSERSFIKKVKMYEAEKEKTELDTKKGAGDVEDRFEYIWNGEYVTIEFKEKVVEISDRLEMNPDDLMGIMAFESWISPTTVNSIGAIGLIQFMPSTAEWLGTSSDELVKMSAIEQLDYVEKYFQSFSGNLNDISDAYMTVLLPAAVGKDKEFALGVKDSNEIFFGKITYGQFYKNNSGLDYNGDGKITKWEATKKVIERRDTYEKK